jgi:hypothetical protein
MTSSATQAPLKVNFKDDSMTTVSRWTLKALAEKLGFNETQVVLFALARLRDEVLDEKKASDFEPLTPLQHKSISAAAPKRKGKVIDSLL